MVDKGLDKHVKNNTIREAFARQPSQRLDSVQCGVLCRLVPPPTAAHLVTTTTTNTKASIEIG